MRIRRAVLSGLVRAWSIYRGTNDRQGCRRLIVTWRAYWWAKIAISFFDRPVRSRSAVGARWRNITSQRPAGSVRTPDFHDFSQISHLEFLVILRQIIPVLDAGLDVDIHRERSAFTHEQPRDTSVTQDTYEVSVVCTPLHFSALEW